MLNNLQVIAQSKAKASFRLNFTVENQEAKDAQKSAQVLLIVQILR